MSRCCGNEDSGMIYKEKEAETKDTDNVLPAKTLQVMAS